MFRILEGGSLIGFYFILGLLVILLAARALEGLKGFLKNRKEPVLKDEALVIDREKLPGGLVVKLTFATLHHGALSLEMREKEAKLIRENSRGILTWKGRDFLSFAADKR